MYAYPDWNWIDTGVILEWDVKTKVGGWLSPSTDFYIIGTIHNTSNKPYWVIAEWTIYDSDGFLDDETGRFSKMDVGPGDKMKIEDQLYGISNGISKIKLIEFKTLTP
tara:strand:+ start:178 stop:501 length:324 start_codon:yes stop_codon:yes gene_type:complete